jgi:hypothetical protein
MSQFWWPSERQSGQRLHVSLCEKRAVALEQQGKVPAVVKSIWRHIAKVTKGG